MVAAGGAVNEGITPFVVAPLQGAVMFGARPSQGCALIILHIFAELEGDAAVGAYSGSAPLLLVIQRAASAARRDLSVRSRAAVRNGQVPTAP